MEQTYALPVRFMSRDYHCTFWAIAKASPICQVISTKRKNICFMFFNALLFKLHFFGASTLMDFHHAYASFYFNHVTFICNLYHIYSFTLSHFLSLHKATLCFYRMRGISRLSSSSCNLDGKLKLIRAGVQAEVL